MRVSGHEADGAKDVRGARLVGDTVSSAIRTRPAISSMTIRSLACARALCATSRKRIGLVTSSGAGCVARLAAQHGKTHKFVSAQRERVRQAVDVAFTEPVVVSLAEPLPHAIDTW